MPDFTPENIYKIVSDYIVTHPFEVTTFIFGTILSLWLYKKAKVVKNLSFMVKNFNLIEGSLRRVEDIQVYYKENKVENLTVSKFFIWNTGTETVEGRDIASRDRLRIEPVQVNGGTEFRILDIKILHTSKPANDVQVAFIEEDNRVEINFDFLDKGDGLLLQVYHTGTSKDQVTLKGTIRGIKGIRNENFDFRESSERLILSFIFLLLMMVTGFVLSYFVEVTPEDKNALTFLLGLSCMVGAGALITFLKSKQKGYKQFFESI